MPAVLKPCGSFAAYQRHVRAGEPVDEACAQAARDQKNVRKDAQRSSLSAAIVANIAVPDLADAIDELAKARFNLSVVEAAMSAGVPTGLAALSKQHSDLVSHIKRLETANKPEMSALDQLAQRRAERLARTAI